MSVYSVPAFLPLGDFMGSLTFFLHHPIPRVLFTRKPCPKTATPEQGEQRVSETLFCYLQAIQR